MCCSGCGLSIGLSIQKLNNYKALSFSYLLGIDLRLSSIIDPSSAFCDIWVKNKAYNPWKLNRLRTKLNSNIRLSKFRISWSLLITCCCSLLKVCWSKMEKFEDCYRQAQMQKYECLLFGKPFSFIKFMCQFRFLLDFWPFFFKLADLDDTLYPLSSGIAKECRKNIEGTSIWWFFLSFYMYVSVSVFFNILLRWCLLCRLYGWEAWHRQE